MAFERRDSGFNPVARPALRSRATVACDFTSVLAEVSLFCPINSRVKSCSSPCKQSVLTLLSAVMDSDRLWLKLMAQTTHTHSKHLLDTQLLYMNCLLINSVKRFVYHSYVVMLTLTSAVLKQYITTEGSG